MEEFNIHEVAEENNLDVISTTTGKNGYPQSVKYAITGFPNFSEAEKLAEKYGLRITTFQVWYTKQQSEKLPVIS